MKHLAAVCLFVFAGCVEQAGGEEQGSAGTASTSQAEMILLPEPPPVLIQRDASQSVTYTPGSVTAADIWPTDRGITSVEVVLTQGPVRSGGPTYLAFVVWNGNFVAHIYCSYFGRPGTALHNLLADTLAANVTLGPDYGAVITGSGTGGPIVPTPHPNVDGEINFSPGYLANMKTLAVDALATSRTTIELPQYPIELPEE
jgi:hypothetical protein